MLAGEPESREKQYRAFMGENEDDTLLRILSLKKLPSIAKRAVFNEARAMGLYLSRYLRGQHETMV
jgi:hypothetical protein